MQFSPVIKELCEIASVNYPELQKAISDVATAHTKLQNALLKRSTKVADYRKKVQLSKAKLDRINQTMKELSSGIQREMGIQPNAYAMIQKDQSSFIIKVKNVELKDANGTAVVSVLGCKMGTEEEVNVILVDNDNNTNMEIINYPY
jgi:hypothetical protein